MKLGVVADDITGANDIGSMFAKGGCLTHVYPFTGAGDFAAQARGQARPDVCILDTNSRLDTPALAYEKVYAATRELQAAGCERFYNKTCSVFRGNIGAEFDAMLDALGQEFALVVLGFPKNGRTTLHGIHYVRGVRLEQSEFRHDPVHPMLRSDLTGILQAQTRRPVAHVEHAVIAQGAPSLRAYLHAVQAHCGYVILDVLDQDDLRTIAAATEAYPVLCGSSALAEELPALWGYRPPPPPAATAQNHGPVLCIAGSLMPQTAAQVRYLREQGVPALVLDTARLFEPGAREGELSRLARALCIWLQAGEDTLLQSPGEPEAVARTREAGARAGLAPTEVARAVSEALAEVAGQVATACGQERLVVAGGETSAAVCARLRVTGLRIGAEIQPGLPACVTLGSPSRQLVLKSGSFGTPDFLAQAIAHLRMLA